MKALVFKAAHDPPVHQEMPNPTPIGDQVVVEIKAAALNHRDVWITKGLYPGLRSGAILGSDGAGSVNGKSYLINPNIGWGPDERVAATDYRILGMPDDGTFAEKIALSPDRLEPKPEHLTWAEAAALPLAGLTAFRVLFSKCRLQSGERVCISGIGGGVALLAMQFALAAGAEVWVTSSSQEKIERAKALGAAGGALYTEDGWSKTLAKNSGGFDVLVDSAAGPGFKDLLATANPGGRLGIYGGTRGKISGLSPQLVFWKELEIHGSKMGSDREFKAMVNFVDRHRIHPIIDQTFPLSEGEAAFKRLADGAQFGKIVLEIS